MVPSQYVVAMNTASGFGNLYDSRSVANPKKKLIPWIVASFVVLILVFSGWAAPFYSVSGAGRTDVTESIMDTVFTGDGSLPRTIFWMGALLMPFPLLIAYDPPSPGS